MRFIFFTKTSWKEPPRLRHQLAKLLSKNNHQVIFFEVPSYAWNAKANPHPDQPEISFRRHRQLLHHKLRLLPLLHYINAFFEKKQIRKQLSSMAIRQDDVIVNFNYDYFFLRDLFPSSPLITLINDDHWCRAIAGYEKPLKWGLQRTCQISDAVLTVSTRLASTLSDYCEPKLFLPWADVQYSNTHKADKERNVLLYWGFIGERIDVDYVLTLLALVNQFKKGIRLVFVGPVQQGSGVYSELQGKNNIEFLPSSSLSEMNLENVLAGFIPYKANHAENDAIMLPNKALQLLARGIPLAITGMPDFIKEPFVYRLAQGDRSDLNTLDLMVREFHSVQKHIKAYVENNSSQIRLDQFMSTITACRK
jgi:hypothetical protein